MNQFSFKDEFLFKGESKSLPYIYLSFDNYVKGCYDLTWKYVVISKDVCFSNNTLLAIPKQMVDEFT